MQRVIGMDIHRTFAEVVFWRECVRSPSLAVDWLHRIAGCLDDDFVFFAQAATEPLKP